MAKNIVHRNHIGTGADAHRGTCRNVLGITTSARVTPIAERQASALEQEMEGRGGGRKSKLGRRSLRKPNDGDLRDEDGNYAGAPAVAEGASLSAVMTGVTAKVHDLRSGTKVDAGDAEWVRSMIPGAKPIEEEVNFLIEMYDKSDMKGVILPFAPWKLAWDVVGQLLVLYTILMLPLDAMYSMDFTGSPVVQGIEVVMDCFFIADVILCTRTAYVQEEDAFLVIDRKSIVRNYMWDGKMSWMTLDIVASVPWTILTLIIQASVPNAGAESLNLIKLAKTPKVFRVGRLLKMIQHLPAAANNIRILILVGFLVIIIHLASGVWYLLHFQRLANEGLYGDATGGVLAPDPYEAYAASFYTTMMSLVGDDVGPESNGEYFFCSVIVLVGAFMNALIFAQVTNLVAQLTAVSQTHQRKMEGIATAMRALRLPKKLTERVNDYYDYIWVRHRDHAGDAFIRSLPYQLRSRISVVVHDQLVRSCALFAEVNTKMIAAIATSLEPEVYLPGEFVVVAGCVSRAMYFISRGKVQLMKRDESRNLTAEEVLQFFNELALFSVSTKTTSLSARSLTHCDLYSLHKRDFDRIMRDFPGPAMKMADAMLAYARKAEECLDDDIVFDYSIKDAKVICKAVYEIVGKPELMPNLSIVVKSLLKPRIKKLLKMMRESPQPDWIAQRVGKEHYSPDARADYEQVCKDAVAAAHDAAGIVDTGDNDLPALDDDSVAFSAEQSKELIVALKASVEAQKRALEASATQLNRSQKQLDASQAQVAQLLAAMSKGGAGAPAAADAMPGLEG